MTYTSLITAEELHELDKVKIFDCRAALGDSDYGQRVYAAGHIPTASYLSLDDDLANPPGDGGRHPLPRPDSLAMRLQELGVSDDSQVVVYDDAGGAYAARAWWCLRWLGHEAVAVLDGGLAAWTGPLDTTTPHPTPGNFSIRPALTRTIDAAELKTSAPSRMLVDARTRARFAGDEEPIDPVAGHIPGAVCLPFQENLAADGHFQDPDALRQRFADAGSAELVVCYCGSGVTAAHNILAMKIAGYPDPALYPGSWSEWIRDPDREIATGDS
jgi:thiosulfate/3-mercaptopyruvate sulfurtransferase